MHKQIECPPASLLEEFVGGRLIDPELSGLSQHLEDCASCQEKAKTLSPHDTLVEALRGKSLAADAIARDIPRPLVEKLKHLSQVSSDTIGVSVDAAPVGRDAELNFLTAPQQPDEIGRLGHYRILKVLGKGGMGVVFLADDPKLDRQVALKVMLPKVALNPSAKDRFLREARAAAKLKSDHIVTIYQVDEVNGVPYLAMELLEGKPLDDYIRDGRALSVEQIIRIARDVAKGLAAAHEKGLIHRDIKPANLWLDHTNGGRVKILDFGLARSQKDDVHLTQSGTIVGTPAFMAPEQAHGEKTVDGRADLFSLGCVLYRLCAGDIPFKSETTMGMLLAIATKHPAAPIESNTNIPVALSELTMKLLDKDPARRPASARDVIARLNEIERSLPIRGSQAEVAQLAPTPRSTSEEITKVSDIVLAPAPKRSRPGLGWLVAPALALLLLGGGAFGIYQLFFNTPNGRIVVEINDDDIEARFKKGKIELYDKAGKLLYTLEPSQRDKDLPPGNYGIKVAGADGLQLDTDKFEMKRGDKVVVKILLERVALAKKAVEIKQVKDAPPVNSKFALEFDGKSVVDIPSLSRDDNSPITVETFVTLDNVRGSVIARMFGGGGCQLYGWPSTDKSPRWVPNAIDGGGKFFGAAPGLEPNRRYHLAMQLDGTRAEIYLDGKKIREEKRNPGTLNDPIRGTILGADNSNGKNGLIGKLDNLRISKGFRYSNDFTPASRFAPDKETIALYHFDEGEGDKLTDSSGNGHHGKIVGAKWVKASGPSSVPLAGTPTYALSFDGAAIGVSFPLFPGSDSGPLTLEAYLIRGNPGNNDSLNANILGTTYFSIQSRGDSRSAGVWIEPKKGEKPAFTRLSITNSLPDRPIHVALVWTGNKALAFLDGKLVDSKETGPGQILRHKLTMGNKYQGMMREVRISKAARYTIDFTPAARHEPDADTLALYHFDEGQGDVLKDSSGNGHHGKIVGAKWVKGEVANPIPSSRYALAFEGNGGVFLPLRYDGSHPFTAEAWVTVTNFTPPDRHQNVIADYAGAGFNLGIHNAGPFWKCPITGTNGMVTLEPKEKIIPNRKTHVALTIEAGKARFFLDGKLFQEQVIRGNYKPSHANLCLARCPDGLTLNGQLFEVRLSKTNRYPKDFSPLRRFEPDGDTLALYHFDEGQGDVLKDSSGNGHHGKIVGAKWVKADGTPITPPSAPNTFALEFDGVSNYAEVPTLAFPQNGAVTIEAYLTSNKVTTQATVLRFQGPSKGGSIARIDQKGTGWSGLAGIADQRTGAIASLAAQPGMRRHVAIVWDGKGDAALFIDGRRSAETTNTKAKDGLRAGLLLGSSFTSKPLSSFAGRIEEVRVSKGVRYDKDFTPASRHAPDADTLALYHFDEGEGDVLKDSSGNGHHGKISGAKWVKADGTPIPTTPALRYALQFETRGASWDHVHFPTLFPDLSSLCTVEAFVTSYDNSGVSYPFLCDGGWLVRGAKNWIASSTANDSKGQRSPTGIDVKGTVKVVVRQRTHVALVSTGRQFRLYVDGVLSGQADFGDLTLDKTKRILALARGFSGDITEVRVSKVARYDKDFTPQQRFEPDADTLALYHFDEGQGDVLRDSSGNGHHGKIVGAKWVNADGTPVAPFALRFENGDIVECPKVAGSHRDFTLEGWFLAEPEILAKVPAVGYIWMKNQAALGFHGPGGWRLSIYNGKGGAVFGVQGPKKAPTSVWTHVATVCQGDRATVFVNGKIEKQEQGKPIVPIGGFPFQLGDKKVVGSMREVRISKVARYTKDFTPAQRFEPDADTLALYHFDEGSGDVLKDSSGNGHHGKIVGAKWVNADGAPIRTNPVYALEIRPETDIVFAKPLIHDPARETFCLEGHVTPRNNNEGELNNSLFGFTDGGPVLSMRKSRLHLSAHGLPGNTVIQTEPILLPNQRFHFAVVRDGKEISLYLNGKIVDKKALEGTSFGKAIPLLFAVGEFSFVGMLHEVRISKAARYDKDFTPKARFETDKDTLALYHFDEGKGDVLTDASGNNHHGKIVGAKWVKADGAAITPPAPLENVVAFDGTASSYASVESLKLPRSAPVTLEGYVIVTEDRLGRNDHLFGAGPQFFVRINPIERVVSLARHLENKTDSPLNSNVRLTPGRKIHVAGVWSPTQMLVFVDGKRVASKEVGPEILTESAQKFLLGHHFAGRIQEVRVSKTARYDKDFTPAPRFETDKDTLALYHIDEGVGDKLIDASGNGHHGKIIGAKWVKADGTLLDPDRRAADFVLSLGGSVGTHHDASWIRDAAKLPREAFQLTAFDLQMNQQLSDASLANFKDCVHLRYVNLDRTKVSDDGLAVFKGSKGLTVLHLGATEVSNGGLGNFKDCDQLTELGLAFNKVSDAGLAHFRNCKKLTILYLPSTQTTDAGLAHFKNCTDLAIVHLYDTAIGDAGLAHLTECKNLKELHMQNTHMSDISVDFLKNCKKLTSLRVEKTKISAAKIEELRKVLPACKIEWDGGVIEPRASLPFPALDPAWLKAVAAMPGTQQVRAVAEKLQERNLGFDGSVTPKFDQAGVVTGLEFRTDNVTDISPVRALTGLRSLTVSGTGMPPVYNQRNGKLADLAPLAGMKLTFLDVQRSQVSDLSPLQGMELSSLNCGVTNVADLSPLKGMKLTFLHCWGTRVTDLAPLTGMKLEDLNCGVTKITDLAPLRGMPLKKIQCEFDRERHGEILRTIPTLEKINNKDAKEFLKAASATPFPPLDRAWLKAVAAMQADKQVEAVKAQLMKRNLGFDGAMTHKLDKDGVVTELEFLTDNVTDIAPVRALTGLRTLRCGGSAIGKERLADLSPLEDMKLTSLSIPYTKVSDLSPLKNLKLTRLECYVTLVKDLSPLKDMKLTDLAIRATKVSDLSPLKGMMLTSLDCGSTPVSDLSQLKDMKLTVLVCHKTRVSDLSPLTGMPLTKLVCHLTKVTDLSPIQGIPLKEIECDFKKERDGAILQSIKTLEKINGQPAAEVLKAAGVGAPAIAPEGAPLSAAERKAMEFVFSAGARVSIDARGPVLTKVADLPLGAVRIDHIWFSHNPRFDNASAGRPITEADLDKLRGLPPVSTVFLESSAHRLTAAGIDRLLQIPGLATMSSLAIESNEPLGPSLKHVARLRSLIQLDLFGLTPEDGPFLGELSILPNLESLRLIHKKTGDLQKLKTLSKLTQLDLGQSLNVNEHASKLAELSQLRQLFLHHTDLSDAGLRHVATLRELKQLSLGDTKITDAGLLHLYAMSELTELHLTQLKLTTAGINQLAAKLPRCRIIWDGAVIEPKAHR